MCLDRTAKFKPTREGIGYKWVLRESFPGGFIYKTTCEYFRLESKGWNKAEKTAHRKKDNGFHIFDRKSGALKSEWGKQLSNYREIILVQVEYGKRYHVGYGDGNKGKNLRIIVAQRMRILKEVKI